ncbi:MAG: YkgJ family cysteine cluster protein [Candidatus Thorarchaeota archaeon]|nr:YkgJ family cysteine cluster protein [Candidatus Thorarchaeota archaeon]
MARLMPISSTKTGDNRGVCIACGAMCCKLGGALAMEEEVEAIRAHGYPDYFEQVSEGAWMTRWGDDGVCPYLTDDGCAIYEVRPLRCRAFPVIQMSSGEVFLSQCPLAEQMSPDTMEESKNLLLQTPAAVLVDSARHLSRHAAILKMRISRYGLRPIR